MHDDDDAPKRLIAEHDAKLHLCEERVASLRHLQEVLQAEREMMRSKIVRLLRDCGPVAPDFIAAHVGLGIADVQSSLLDLTASGMVEYRAGCFVLCADGDGDRRWPLSM
jgi:predicted Rossmann fold nucleotide-binding protein DprA/Smf involved in DNA uptake